MPVALPCLQEGHEVSGEGRTKDGEIFREDSCLSRQVFNDPHHTSHRNQSTEWDRDPTGARGCPSPCPDRRCRPELRPWGLLSGRRARLRTALFRVTVTSRLTAPVGHGLCPCSPGPLGHSHPAQPRSFPSLANPPCPHVPITGQSPTVPVVPTGLPANQIPRSHRAAHRRRPPRCS